MPFFIVEYLAKRNREAFYNTPLGRITQRAFRKCYY